jgi:hypothetical protein
MSLDKVAPSQEFSLLSRANEREVKEGWLLANLRPGLSPQPTPRAHDSPPAPQPSQSSAHDPQPLSSAHGPQPTWPSAHNPQESETHTPENEHEETLDPDLTAHDPQHSETRTPDNEHEEMDQDPSTPPSAPATRFSPAVDLDPGTNFFIFISCLVDINRSQTPKWGILRAAPQVTYFFSS